MTPFTVNKRRHRRDTPCTAQNPSVISYVFRVDYRCCTLLQSILGADYAK